MKVTAVLVLALALLLGLSSANLPRDVQKTILTTGRGVRYSPDLLNYSRRPFGNPPQRYVAEVEATKPRALEDYQLPTDVYPISYDIQLVPFLETPPERAWTFEGSVNIRVRARVVTTSIVMHAWDLDVSTIGVIRTRDGTSIPVSDYSILTDDSRFFTINLAEALEAGQEYDVFVFYTGSLLHPGGYGFFRSEYRDENGNSKWLTATQFESTAARRAFPCFDQPNLKASFKLSIAQQPGFNAIANMPVQTEGDPVEGLPGWVWKHFQPSPPMSTYLVAFSTNEFDSVASLDGLYRVWSRPAVAHTGQFALDISPQLVAHFEDFTGHAYSLPKLEQIGMIDFFSGAMENWGLITYQEPYLLHDPLEDDTAWKQLTGQVIAHEIAHQWHGDLVSPLWWSSLWLNEGFATYHESFGLANAIGQGWQLGTQFVIDNTHYALRTDADESHPIYADVSSPLTIDSIFDSITYSKGGSLVRFMIKLLGENNFKLGINEYLTAKAFDAAEQDDLFFHLSPHAPQMPLGYSFKNLMDTWTLQAGFPLLTVNRNYAAQTATVSQRRFGFVGTEQWIVPITATNGASPDFNDLNARGWLLPGDDTILEAQAGVPGPQDWFIINLQQTGFYRVNYDLANWGLLAAGLEAPGSTDVIHEVNRMQLMDDALALVEAGLLDYTTFLRMTSYLGQETRLGPWIVATYVLEYVRDRVYQTAEGIQNFRTYMQDRMANVYGFVSGFEQADTDEHGVIMTRRLVTRWTVDVQFALSHTDGAVLFDTWKVEADPDTNNPIHLDLREPAYCAGHFEQGAVAHDFLLARYRGPSVTGDERERIISALGCSNDAALLQRSLDESMDSSVILPEDAQNVLAAVYGHPQGVDIALDFLIANWETLDSIYGSVGYGFVGISGKLNTQEHYDKLILFRDSNDAQFSPLTRLLVGQSISSLESIMAWNAANLNTVMDYFRPAPTSSQH